jgi:hypothetical protein
MSTAAIRPSTTITAITDSSRPPPLDHGQRHLPVCRRHIPRSPRVTPVDPDEWRRQKARNLVGAAGRAGRPHLVFISVVGADRMPVVSALDRAAFGYFPAKRAAEDIVSGSGLPWTTLRATQFHELTLEVCAGMATTRSARATGSAKPSGPPGVCHHRVYPDGPGRSGECAPPGWVRGADDQVWR